MEQELLEQRIQSDSQIEKSGFQGSQSDNEVDQEAESEDENGKCQETETSPDQVIEVDDKKGDELGGGSSLTMC